MVWSAFHFSRQAMAEVGAHITGVADSNVPSIFEVLAQENLVSSLRPALQYLLKVGVNMNDRVM